MDFKSQGHIIGVNFLFYAINDGLSIIYLIKMNFKVQKIITQDFSNQLSIPSNQSNYIFWAVQTKPAILIPKKINNFMDKITKILEQFWTNKRIYSKI